MAIAALAVLLLYGCARPQGTVVKVTIQPSAKPVAHAPLTIANPVFHSGEVGVTYAPVTLSANGGVAPYTWMVVVGSLPAGLALSSDGIISGTPTQNGFFPFSVQVFDKGNDDTAGVSANIPIVPRLTASLVPACATECTVELGCVTVCGTFGQTSGGIAPMTYTLTVGVLPAGTTLSGLTLNGTFIGLPGRLQFTVQVTDGFGVTTTISPKYNLLPHITLASGSCYSSFYATTPCVTSLAYSGGSGTPTVTVKSASGQLCTPGVTGGFVCKASSSPPPNFSATVSGSTVAILVPATRISPFTYSGTVVLSLTDQNPCGSGASCSTTGSVGITINAG